MSMLAGAVADDSLRRADDRDATRALTDIRVQDPRPIRRAAGRPDRRGLLPAPTAG